MMMQLFGKIEVVTTSSGSSLVNMAMELIICGRWYSS